MTNNYWQGLDWNRGGGHKTVYWGGGKIYCHSLSIKMKVTHTNGTMAVMWGTCTYVCWLACLERGANLFWLYKEGYQNILCNFNPLFLLVIIDHSLKIIYFSNEVQFLENTDVIYNFSSANWKIAPCWAANLNDQIKLIPLCHWLFLG